MSLQIKMKFLKSKYFLRAIAFFFILTPMLLLQLHEDRTLLDLALKDREADQCHAIKRNYFKANCFSKIADRKEAYCNLLPIEARPECIEKEVDVLRIEAQNTPQKISFLLAMFELVFLLSLATWLMGLTPQSLVLKYFRRFHEICLSPSFVIIRIGMAILTMIVFHLVWGRVISHF
ncbi:MAG: hypothetical protein CME71_06095 [Halobacteriovorax sp.]|nr:hypothetical protein [Halobacteriovorax sp.]|tara:strand:- start:360 stop:890 length:531 start_codon:yes stop_codon:yes gene_type:complete